MMESERWVERAERGWGRCCREVGSVLHGALTVLRLRWGWFLILAVAAFVVRLPYLKWLVPFGEQDSWVIAGALVVSHTQMFLNFVLALVCWNLGVSALRGEAIADGRTLLSRVWRSLPWLLAVYVVEMGSSLLGLGFFKAAELLCGFLEVKEPSWMLSGAYYVGGLPLLFVLARFGQCLIGAAVGERVTPAGSLDMTRGHVVPLLLTLALWFVFHRPPPMLIAVLISPRLPAWFYPWVNWGILLYVVVVFVFFSFIPAVWYERLRPRTEAGRASGAEAEPAPSQD